jgi:hypothetical protein
LETTCFNNVQVAMNALHIIWEQKLRRSGLLSCDNL